MTGHSRGSDFAFPLWSGSGTGRIRRPACPIPRGSAVGDRAGKGRGVSTPGASRSPAHRPSRGVASGPTAVRAGRSPACPRGGWQMWRAGANRRPRLPGGTCPARDTPRRSGGFGCLKSGFRRLHGPVFRTGPFLFY
jgi:hypothetical protein